MLSKKMSKMLITLHEKCCAQMMLCDYGIVDRKYAENEIKRLFDEFKTMVTSMYHFGLLTDNDTWFVKPHEMDGKKLNIYHILCCLCDFEISGEIIFNDVKKLFYDIGIM